MTYKRRCDECGQTYEHTRGAPTGFCEGCIDRLRKYALVELPAIHDSDHPYHLPYVQEFERAW